MALTGRRKRLLEEQEARIFKMFADGVSDRDIETVEGADPTTIKEKKRKARARGLPIRKGVSSAVPYGIDDESQQFRTRLGRQILRLLEEEDKHPLEISRDVGLTQKTTGSFVRKQIAHPHNWTLSELQRLAKALDITFTELMLRLLKPGEFSTPEDRQAWKELTQVKNTG